jgi:hypothetical protein
MMETVRSTQTARSGDRRRTLVQMSSDLVAALLWRVNLQGGGANAAVGDGQWEMADGANSGVGVTLFLIFRLDGFIVFRYIVGR